MYHCTRQTQKTAKVWRLKYFQKKVPKNLWWEYSAYQKYEVSTVDNNVVQDSARPRITFLSAMCLNSCSFHEQYYMLTMFIFVFNVSVVIRTFENVDVLNFVIGVLINFNWWKVPPLALILPSHQVILFRYNCYEYKREINVKQINRIWWWTRNNLNCHQGMWEFLKIIHKYQRNVLVLERCIKLTTFTIAKALLSVGTLVEGGLSVTYIFTI